MNTGTTEVRRNMADEFDEIRDCIYAHEASMLGDDLWAMQERICRVATFLHNLPEEVEEKVLMSQEYSFNLNDLMETWSADIGPARGWPKDTRARQTPEPNRN